VGIETGHHGVADETDVFVGDTVVSGARAIGSDCAFGR
jgi:hypothetical protein